MHVKQYSPGVGPTKKLPLRVSVAALVRVLFKNPENGKSTLALERTATMLTDKDKPEVVVKAKPFGGGVRLLNPRRLKKYIGGFHYDSERSREQEDFRIQINPDHWERIKEICIAHLKDNEKGILNPSPVRELAEEFEDSLGISVTPDQYDLKQEGMIVEDLLTETDNINASGLPTVRIYYIFEAMLKNLDMIKMLMNNSNHYSDADLQKMAKKDTRLGGKGRANAVLTVGLAALTDFYHSVSPDRRCGPVHYEEHQLDGNVPAILNSIQCLKYHRYL